MVCTAHSLNNTQVYIRSMVPAITLTLQLQIKTYLRCLADINSEKFLQSPEKNEHFSASLVSWEQVKRTLGIVISSKTSLFCNIETQVI